MSKQIIICVDDEIIVLDALKEQLQNEFHEDMLIEIAESGEEAIEVFDEFVEEGYDIPVILADFIMPKMKGDDLLEIIHKKSPLTKKIMLTGQATIEGVGNAVNKANLYRYISKPWDKADLLLTIKEAIKSFNQEKTINRQYEELKELNLGLEEKIEQRTKELTELNRTKDKFFSIIAHDLKNPFNSLLGFSELLLENIESFTIDQIEKYIYIIFETSQSSFALLENLLDWSRSQTGRISIDKEVIDLYRLADDNVTMLQNQAHKKEIYIHNDIYPGTTGYADINIINTVIRNLLANAVKYTSKGDSITIDCEKAGNMLKVNVTDTGVGISEDIANRLFKIGENVSTKGTADESGTGLGLILCKEFIEKNGGKIWVESVEGQGTTFYFTLEHEKQG